MNRLAIRPQTSSGSFVEQPRAGLDPVAGDRRQHDRRGRGRRDAQGQQRHEAAGGRGVVGRLRAGDALDGALAELLGVLGEPLLGDVGEERRDLRAAGRDRPEREPDGGAAQPGLPGAAPVLAAHPRVADRDHLDRLAAQVGRRPQRLAHGEQADRDDDDARCRRRAPAMPKVSRCWPEVVSMPIRPIARPRPSEARPRTRELPSTEVTAMKASTMIAKNCRRGRPPRPSRRRVGRHERQQRGSRWCRRRTSRSPPWPAPGPRGRPLAILLPSMAVTTDALSPGVFSRIDVVDPPYMPP